jgi:Leucine-rich repeat (LRR) protein
MLTEIETYLNSLSEDILILSIEGRGITDFPDINRFKFLKEIYCSDNHLSSLPSTMPQSLEILYCSSNPLTSLPDFTRFINLKELYFTNNKLSSLPSTIPQSLEKLYCSNNQLTSMIDLTRLINLKELDCSHNLLPFLSTLPKNLILLYCFNNELTYLPSLPDKLIYFCGWDNPVNYILDDNNNNLIKVKQKIKIINTFRYLYYSLRFKKQFRKCLWEKIREKKIMDRYHPIYILENLKENTDLDEFLEKWN